MIWEDTGFLLSKNKYNENSLIVEIFTKDHGKISGIIFGGTSKKIKNYLQIGNSLHVNFHSKSTNSIGYFKVEILRALSPLYFDNQKKLSCIFSAMNLIKLLTAESQKNVNIYYLLENFYILLNNHNWIKKYIFWELELLKVLGYQIEFKNLVDKIIVDNKIRYVSKSTKEKKIVPSFLVENEDYFEDINSLLKALKIVGDFLEKSVLRPNNLSQPLSRLEFINTLK
tara:strand:+ start:55 stop:735 length:681 start_codon:yes stop_codon:yes gene_type:complete